MRFLIVEPKEDVILCFNISRAGFLERVYHDIYIISFQNNIPCFVVDSCWWRTNLLRMFLSWHSNSTSWLTLSYCCAVLVTRNRYNYKDIACLFLIPNMKKSTIISAWCSEPDILPSHMTQTLCTKVIQALICYNFWDLKAFSASGSVSIFFCQD